MQEVQTDYGPAVNFVGLTGPVAPGELVLLNRTATCLNLGTGGYDFVMANLSAEPPSSLEIGEGHIVKARYTPVQHAVLALEERPEHASVWQKRLEGFPVIVGQLHSQLAPVSSALHQSGARVAYVMTDAASLPIGFSRMVRLLKLRKLHCGFDYCRAGLRRRF